MSSRDVDILRPLAWQVAEIAAKPIQNERRDLWRRHNALQRTRPLIYVRWFSSLREIVDPQLVCQDSFFRPFERKLRELIYQDLTGDDFIIEPWLTLRAAYKDFDENRRWGVPFRNSGRTEAQGSVKFDPPIKEESDIDRIVAPRHQIDEAATQRNLQRLGEAVGDILPTNLDRGPWFRAGVGDVCHDLAQLRGLEQIMWDMIDRPAWLHRLAARVRDGILATQDQAEAVGDYGLCNHENQSMPYALDLLDPKANTRGVQRKQLWCFLAAQEVALVSPEMHDEFILQYQMPIMARYGLSAYGCCEDLTRKITMLRQIPNLRRIAVAPWADVRACAEQIGTDYVMSWRPSPAEMVCTGFVPQRVRTITQDALAAARGCHIDICLKDIETIGGDFSRLVEWTRITRELAEKFA